MKVIGFNKPTGDNGYLSIYYQAPFYQDGLRFETVEQCFLYQKALTFHDEYRCKKILQTFDSKILNQLVKDIVNYDDKIFSGRRQIILYQANLDKFRYNIELKNQLLATNDAVIALCNKYDLVNGIGLNVDDSRIYKTKNWLGSNLHGFSLMEVRSTLKKEG